MALNHFETRAVRRMNQTRGEVRRAVAGFNPNDRVLARLLLIRHSGRAVGRSTNVTASVDDQRKPTFTLCTNSVGEGDSQRSPLTPHYS